MSFGGPGAVVATAGGGTAVVPALQGDFSLNVSNTLSADAMLGQGCGQTRRSAALYRRRRQHRHHHIHSLLSVTAKPPAHNPLTYSPTPRRRHPPRRLERLTPTHDLNAAQIAALARSLGPAAARRVEAVIHQHLPIFHTEHCAFCRFLSDGNSFKDCGARLCVPNVLAKILVRVWTLVAECRRDIPNKFSQRARLPC